MNLSLKAISRNELAPYTGRSSQVYPLVYHKSASIGETPARFAWKLNSLNIEKSCSKGLPGQRTNPWKLPGWGGHASRAKVFSRYVSERLC